MKIIKVGTKTPPNKKVYIMKCRICGCVFTYREKDMCCLSSEAVGVYCPQCNYSNVPIIRRKYKGVIK